MRKKVEISDAYKLKKNARKLPTPKNEELPESEEITPVASQDPKTFPKGLESHSQSMRLPKHIEAINQSIQQKTRNLSNIESL